jgi:siroheme synthase (precorrin-2 oxidase/ferrochelatase)
MPIVATVEGVKIVFYANEHPPPHFHARIAEYQAVIDIDELKVTEGRLPPAKKRKVLAWAATRQDQLRRAFAKAIAKEPVEPIA